MNRSLLALALLPGLGGLAAVSPAEATTTHAAVVADTYVSKKARFANYGDATRLFVDGRRGSRKHALVTVTVPAVAADETVQKVRLRLRPTRSSRTGVVVHRARTSWHEDSVTWRTKPVRRTRLGASDRLRAGRVETIELDPTKVTPGSALTLRVQTRARRVLGFVSSEARRRGPSVRVITSGSAGGPTRPEDRKPTPDPDPTPEPDRSFPPAVPATPKLVGMSAPAHLWDARIREVGQEGVTARRVFAALTPSGDSKMNLVRRAVADGMMPVISYKVPDVQTMIDGGYDAWLAALRRQLTSLDANVTATFWHEPRGDMEPAQFRAASLKFFEAVDAPSIAVGPILNGWLLDNKVAEFASYTDADLLDRWEFVAVDSYQSGEPTRPGDRMPARAIPLLETWMDSVGHPDKPLGLGEYNGFSAEAIADAGEILLSTPEVWFGLAWNSTGGSYAPLEGDRTAAFRETKEDARAKK